MLDQETINSITANPNFIDTQYHVQKTGEVSKITVTKFKNNPDIVKSTKTELLIGDINFGYQRVNINGKHERVHRLVAYLYCENPNGDNIVNHIDGDKLNNNYTNLEWCTAEHNEKHSLDTSLKPQGESHYLSTFTEAQLRECLSHSDFKPDMRLRDFKVIVASLNVSLIQIKNLLYGNTWHSVTKEYGIIKRSDLAIEDRPTADRARKLTEEQVYEIHKLMFEGKYDGEVARLIGNISRETVGSIRAGKTWKHIKPLQPFPEVNGKQRLTLEVLKQIQDKLTNGYSLNQVANECNVSKALVAKISHNDLPKYLQVA